ncbi:MAG TPA: hypothetical protein VGD91_24450 [Trebonia sp.]
MGLRQANGIIAGITGMHWLKFLIANAIGGALWVGAWVSIGYFAEIEAAPGEQTGPADPLRNGRRGTPA